jgi:endonuclease/exonuclease/phosphatase family metal-dependent hydrolase
VTECHRHPTESSFRASSLYARHGAALEALLSTPRIMVEADPAEVPIAPLGLAHWNIEKGKALAGLKEFLLRERRLRRAAVLTLNEVDVGTARCGNTDVALELARTLRCHAVFLPSYVECTKGFGDDLRAPGENVLGLHGLAILSRLPILDVKVALLPACFDYFSFTEKRFGYRQGLYVRLDWGGRSLVVGTTHLEVRNTPQCRALQFRGFLQGLRLARGAWGSEHPVAVTGDWNTNSFRRGSFARAAREFCRIVGTTPGRLEHALVRPYRQEPLFEQLAAGGLEVEPFNDLSPTASQLLGEAEDLGALPPAVAAAVMRAFRLSGRTLRMRLDWIAGRGLRPATAPWTLGGMSFEGRRLSDHAVIGVEVTAGE